MPSPYLLLPVYPLTRIKNSRSYFEDVEETKKIHRRLFILFLSFYYFYFLVSIISSFFFSNSANLLSLSVVISPAIKRFSDVNFENYVFVKKVGKFDETVTNVDKTNGEFHNIRLLTPPPIVFRPMESLKNNTVVLTSLGLGLWRGAKRRVGVLRDNKSLLIFFMDQTPISSGRVMAR